MSSQLKLDGHTEVIYFVEAILHHALSYGASDIHIERYDSGSRLRYRLDGVLQEVKTDAFMQEQYAGIVSRIKLLAGLDIAERRLPQDGRFSFDYDNGTVDIRVSIVPSISAERVVLRLLDSGGFMPSLESVGMDEQSLALMRQTLKRNQGMLLVTGPTGSGKTTTLYAGIHAINQPDINILTVEDPIEYKISGVNQVEVKESIGLDFAHALRAFLRQDPEVILVGEIRDYETADIAIKAALTGHLVMSTLHTRNISGTIARLINIGLPAYLVAAAINLIVCQRLLRKTCRHCKSPCESLPPLLVPKINGKKPLRLYRGKGCRYCRHTGYSGRQAVYEMMPVDDELGHVISNYTDSPSDAERQLKARYTTTLEQAGLDLLYQGIISPEEYLRVLG
ncbi:MAG: type II/IV secretion system protein [Gammaproteobacteria bacterium]|nr:type II/IV secretion system protein [Gammaproteobacteria bacterium]